MTISHRKSGTKTFFAWSRMLSRCRNPKVARFKNYGGRGIKVCERWQSFENFYADMGELPPGMSLDRIDNDGNYEPGNCRWATATQQARNKRTTRRVLAYGLSRTCAEWSYESGIPEATIYMRVFKKGWRHERAVSEPTSRAIVRYQGRYRQNRTTYAFPQRRRFAHVAKTTKVTA